MKYRIFHHDTFEEPGYGYFEIGNTDTLEEARKLVKDKYGNRISPQGADIVDIILDNKVIEQYKIK